MSRGRYEFSQRTKDSAVNKWRWNNPDRDDEDLEVDHIVPVWAAKELGIPADLVRTDDNARALTVGEHKDRHRNESDLEEYRSLAQSILGWIDGLFGEALRAQF